MSTATTKRKSKSESESALPLEQKRSSAAVRARVLEQEARNHIKLERALIRDLQGDDSAMPEIQTLVAATKIDRQEMIRLTKRAESILQRLQQAGTQREFTEQSRRLDELKVAHQEAIEARERAISELNAAVAAAEGPLRDVEQRVNQMKIVRETFADRARLPEKIRNALAAKRAAFNEDSGINELNNARSVLAGAEAVLARDGTGWVDEWARKRFSNGLSPGDVNRLWAQHKAALQQEANEARAVIARLEPEIEPMRAAFESEMESLANCYLDLIPAE